MGDFLEGRECRSPDTPCGRIFGHKLGVLSFDSLYLAHERIILVVFGGRCVKNIIIVVELFDYPVQLMKSFFSIIAAH